jgi:hypothetical protein
MKLGNLRGTRRPFAGASSSLMRRVRACGSRPSLLSTFQWNEAQGWLVRDPSTCCEALIAETGNLTWAVSETGVVNMPAIIDYQFRAVHQVTVATKQYVEAYYSQPIDHAYFDGCSNGGRQSLMEGEHYPVELRWSGRRRPRHRDWLAIQGGQGLHPNPRIYPLLHVGAGRHGGEGEQAPRQP